MNKPYLKSGSFIFKLASAIFILILIIIIHSCRKDFKTSQSSARSLNTSTINLGMLQKNYNKGTAATRLKLNDVSRQTLANIINSLTVDWTSYTISTYPDSTQVIEFAMPDDTALLSPAMPAIGDSAKYYTKTSAVFILRKDTVNFSFFMKTVENGTAPGYQSTINYLHYQQIPTGFTGNVYYFTLNRDYLNGWGWQNGSLVSTVNLEGIAAQTNNVHKLRPSEEAAPCTETTYTFYWYQTDAEGNVTYEEDLFSIIVTTCPASGDSGGTSAPGGAVGGATVTQTVPCNPSSAPVSSQFVKGKRIEQVAPVKGGESGGDTTVVPTTQPCPGNPPTTTTTTTPPTPCATAAQLSAIATTAVIKSQDSSILSKTQSSGYEYGANQNLTSLTSNTYVNTPVTTQNSDDSWTPTFTWDAVNGFTVGFSHGHPGDTGPSPFDVNAIVAQINQTALRSSNTALQFYENHAYVNTETQTGSYMVTVSNWPAVIATLNTSFATTTQQNTFNTKYQNFDRDYQTANPNATQGDAGAYALLQMFPGEINVYYAEPGSTTYTPVVAGNYSLNPVKCPTN